VGSAGSQAAWKKGGKRVARAEDWLMDTTQPARKRSRNILRSPEVRDPRYTVTDCSAAIRRFTTGNMLPCHALDTGNFVTFP